MSKHEAHALAVQEAEQAATGRHLCARERVAAKAVGLPPVAVRRLEISGELNRYGARVEPAGRRQAG